MRRIRQFHSGYIRQAAARPLGGLAFRQIGFAFLVVSGLASVSRATATSLPNADRLLTYSVVDQDLRDVIQGLVAQIGLRANISSKIQGRVHGRLEPAPAAQMLDRLAAVYGFDWYCDGDAVYVSAPSEFVSRMLPMGDVSAESFSGTLDSLGIADDRWKPRVSAQDRIVLVDGPPRYVTLVENTLEAMSRREREGPQLVHVFRGNAASAP